ncbi:MAG: FeoA family protein [Candidatus Omnitrophota bacterium]
MTVDLTKMKPGQRAIIKELGEGHAFRQKINNMGIREGKRIKKIASHFWRGPQTIEIDNMKFAIGYRMSKRIIVEVEE